MIKFDDILGQPVLSIQEGMDLGKISKAAVDTNKGKIVAFVVEDKNKKENIFSMEAVYTYGKDAVMVPSENRLKDISKLPEIAEAIAFGRKIIGLKIRTDTGNDIGEISSFHFDEKSGEITHYEASGGLFQDLVEGKGLLAQEGVISIGPDTLLVKETAAELAEIMKVEKGLKHTALQVKAKTKEELKKTANKVKKALGGVKHKKPSK